MKKNVTVASLLEEIAGTKFTGHSILHVHNIKKDLVFKGGLCILAQSGNLNGDQSFSEIKGLDDKIDAELYTFTPTQINLSLEFNNDCIVDDSATRTTPDTQTLLHNKAEGEQRHTPGILKEKGSPTIEKYVELHAKRDGNGNEAANRRHSGDVAVAGGKRREINSIFDFRPSVNPKIRAPKNTFQLPRGRLAESKSNIKLMNLVSHIESAEFTGYCIINFEGRCASLLLERGRCVMIDYPPRYGEEAVKEIQSTITRTVSAELYELSPQQMDLAVEFNDGYWANNWTKGTGISISAVSREIFDMTSATAETTVSTTGTPGDLPDKKIFPREPSPLSQEELDQIVEEEPIETKEEELDDFAQQVRNLENMNMEIMEKRIKENFKDVIKELDLEYLIVERSD
ncbi:MAG TPA: hypothetical protein ENO00_04575 [Deltaproteobacteria bacterium]|nr:hypothetical protein [Deltaproteobacteria bacterium]